MIENSKEENLSGINIYKDLESQVAGKEYDIFFPEVSKWSLNSSPLKEFFKNYYDLNLADGLIIMDLITKFKLK